MNMAIDISKHLGEMIGQAVELPEPTEHWCMVLVRPGYEQNCRDSLRRRGVGAWWPNYAKEMGYKDRESGKRGVRRIMLPVLPGVLLCPARMTTAFWQTLDLAPGALGVARRFNTEMILLHDLDIVLIHKIEEGLNRTDPPKSAHAFVPGDRVRFVDDDFRRFGIGEVVACNTDGTMQVEFSMLGRATPWTIAGWQVEPVDTKRENQPRGKPDARDRPAKSPSGRKAD